MFSFLRTLFEGSARYTHVELEYCGRRDKRSKQGWTRIFATHQVRHSILTNTNQVRHYLELLTYETETREEWSSSQLVSSENGSFSFRGFEGNYRFRFLLNGEQFGDGMDVELGGDVNLRCDFTDGFDEKMCTGGI